MRSLAVTAAALALFSVAACGSDDEPTVASTPSAGTETQVPAAEPSESPIPTAIPTKVAPEPPKESPSAPRTASKAQVASVTEDVQEYAVAMEQFFFDNGYPRDLAGARATAKKLTNLSLSPGNTIATYRFDEGAQEFQLCVENPSGASATYDTQPMSTVQTTNTGGCP